ncbi:MAG: hypothetical protein ACXV4D_01600 [Ilumatobacteraceae bacterium]
MPAVAAGLPGVPGCPAAPAAWPAGASSAGGRRVARRDSPAGRKAILRRVFLFLASSDLVAYLTVLLAGLQDPGVPGLQDLPGTGRPGRRVGCGRAGAGRVPGSAHQSVAPPGDLLVAKEPPGKPVQRAEPTLEALRLGHREAWR